MKTKTSIRGALAARAARSLAALAACLAVGTVMAQGQYPNHPVRIVVPFAAGGGSDVVTRVFAQELGDRLGQSFFVDNKGGGSGGSIGSMEVARSKPDGYNLATGTSSGVLNAAMDPTGYDPLKELDPVARYGATTLVLLVNAKLPIQNVTDFIAYAKAHPGLAYGSSGTGSANHFTGEMMAKVANIELTHVPYRGESAAMIDLVAGQIPSAFVSVGLAKGYIQSGQARALAVTTEKRFPALPDVPTIAEFGIKGMVVDAFYGMYVPKGTPAAVVNVLVKNINEIRAKPEVAKRLLDTLGFDTSGSDDPKAFRSYMQSELSRYSKVAKDIGLVGATK